MILEAAALFVERFPRYTFSLSEWSALPRRAESALEQDLPLAQAQILYLYGLDANVALELLSWVTSDPKRRLIFLEPNGGQIAAFLEHPAAPRLLAHMQIEIHHLPKRAAKQELLQTLSQRYPFAGVFVCYSGGDRREYARLKLQLLRTTALFHGYYANKVRTFDLLAHLKENLAALPGAFYVNQMKDAFASIPAIICGAGPSLQSAIGQLRKLQQRALIVAAGSAVAALSKQGIEPHFVIAIDPNPEEFERFKNSFAFQTPLLFSSRLHPKCLAACNGPLGYIRSGMSSLQELWIEEALGLTEPPIGRDLPDESLSVTMLAAAVACHFGCNPILFDGVDLAYTKNRRYADGVDATECAPQLLSPLDRLVKKRGRSGKTVSSSVRWVMEASALSQFAARHTERRWIQCTADGLILKNIEAMPLSQAAELFPEERDLYGLVHQAISSAPIPKTVAEHFLEKLQELGASLDRLLGQLDQLVENRPGLSVLAELELEEEPAYKILFPDIANTLWAILGNIEDKEAYWKAFRNLALRCKKALLKDVIA